MIYITACDVSACTTAWHVQSLHHSTACTVTAPQHGMYCLCTSARHAQSLHHSTECTVSAPRHGMHSHCTTARHVQSLHHTYSTAYTVTTPHLQQGMYSHYTTHTARNVQLLRQIYRLYRQIIIFVFVSNVPVYLNIQACIKIYSNVIHVE